MKLLMSLILVCLLTSCSTRAELELNGRKRTFESFGMFDTHLKNDSINYDFYSENAFAAIILSETVVVPFIVIGFNLWKPVDVKVEYRKLITPNENNFLQK